MPVGGEFLKQVLGDNFNEIRRLKDWSGIS